MKSPIKITIPKPCNQKWSGMNQNAIGKYCDSCQQSVIDFTHFSDRELKSWFIEDQGKSCGRFKPEQLNRLILEESKFSIKKFKPSLIAASLIAFLSFPKLSIAQVVKPAIDQTDNFSTGALLKNTLLSDSVKIIRGKVIDKDDKSPLPGVNIIVDETLFKTVTNSKGEFLLEIPAGTPTNHSIGLSYIGYKFLTSKFNTNFDSELNLELCTETTAFLGGLIVTQINNPSIWDRLRQVFGKKTKN
jgi:hypothetical protein